MGSDASFRLDGHYEYFSYLCVRKPVHVELPIDMSLTAKANGVCSKCGRTTEITIYKSINTADDPSLKEKVRNGSLFLWGCPHCGTVNLARYETLYHDPEKKLMLWLVPDGKISETQMQAITNHTKAMGGYTLRLVRDMGELMEKVLIFDAGLDDVVLELCKWVTKREMTSNAGKETRLEDKQRNDEIRDAVFHFYRTEGDGDGRAIIFSYASKSQMTGLKIGWNVYEDCEGIIRRNPSVRPGEGFVRVDAAWLDTVVQG